MIFTRIFILSFFIVYSNNYKYSSEQFSEFLSDQKALTDFSNTLICLFIKRKHKFWAFFPSPLIVAIVVIVIFAGAFCGVAPLIFRGKKTRAENYKTSNNAFKNVGETKPSTTGSSDGVVGHFVATTEIRNKISCFRDLLDFSPCLGSTTLLQLLILTLSDIFQRYPQIKPVSEFENASFHKALKIFCDSLRSLGDLWTIENWMVQCRYNSSMRIENVELERVAFLMLEDIIKLARERLYDEMDDVQDMENYSPPANAFSNAFSNSYSDCSSYSGSPLTPTSVLPGSWKSPSPKKGSYSPPTLLPLKLQAAGKLSPIDIERLSFHMLPHAKYMMNEREEREFEQFQDDEVVGEMKMIDVVVHTPDMENGKRKSGKSCNVGVNWIGDQTRPYGAAPPPPPPPPPQPITTPRNFEIAPPPPPLQPITTPRNLGIPPPPPPPVISTNVVFVPPPSPMVNCPPPPPLPTTTTSQSLVTLCTPPPPPPSNGSRPASPPPPPPMDGASKGNRSAPPPPPSVASLRTKKLATKLKRSSQMGNLYRILKGKVEGSTSPVKSPGRKGNVGGSPSGGKQGMADALAEMTKRSSYFIQIEEDVKTYEGVIKELKTAISFFQTSDMSELVKFHKHVESHLEKLTDETQVLARFEDFPGKKLEAIRMASSMHLKLDSIVSALQNWQIVGPVGKLLDKAEGYFSKIKVELDALERTKDEEMKRLEAQKIKFDIGILVRVKELMVDVSSNCMELALKEKREGKNGTAKTLWRAFQFAFRVYSFAGGHDDRADKLTREVAHEIENQN